MPYLPDFLHRTANCKNQPCGVYRVIDGVERILLCHDCELHLARLLAQPATDMLVPHALFDATVDDLNHALQELDDAHDNAQEEINRLHAQLAVTKHQMVEYRSLCLEYQQQRHYPPKPAGSTGSGAQQLKWLMADWSEETDPHAKLQQRLELQRAQLVQELRNEIP